MTAMPDGSGYWFTAADGGLFNYGDAPFYGSGAGTGLGQVVAMATRWPTHDPGSDGPPERPRWGIPASETLGFPPGRRPITTGD